MLFRSRNAFLKTGIVFRTLKAFPVSRLLSHFQHSIFHSQYQDFSNYFLYPHCRLLGGSNSNDIFLGDYTTDINVDRDILVCDTTNGKGESLQDLEAYFQQIWNEGCVKIKGGRKKNSSEISVLEEAADDSEGSESNLKNSDIVNGNRMLKMR